MKTIGIILAGSGRADGSEIHESTLSLLAISKLGAQYKIFAPNINQHHVVDHTNGTEMNESRNVLLESARIARGEISPLSEFDASDIDALIIPGGFGVGKNLCSYAFDGDQCTVNDEVANAILATHKAKKPIGALCIAPVILAQILPGVKLTMGQDNQAALHIQKMGADHIPTNHGEIIVDTENKIISTPCYMLDSNIHQVYVGIEKLVEKTLEIM